MMAKITVTDKFTSLENIPSKNIRMITVKLVLEGELSLDDQSTVLLDK